MAKIKIPNSKQRRNKFTGTKAQKQLTKTPRKQTKSTRKMFMSVFQRQGQSSLTWLANLWNHIRRAWILKEYEGGRGRGELLLEILKNERDFLQSSCRFFHTYSLQLVCDNVPFTFLNIIDHSVIIDKLRQDKSGQVLWYSGERFYGLWSAWYHVYWFYGRLRYSCLYWGGEIYFHLQNLFLCINGTGCRLVLWS